MKFWDSSAVLPLLLKEPHSESVRKIAQEDDGLVAWWGASLECRSAFARLRRDGTFNAHQEDQLIELLNELSNSWTEIVPTENVRNIAARLLLSHPLRAADSLQLAAALVWSGSPNQKSSFVCFDVRLREAARLEGFVVLPKNVRMITAHE